MNRMLFYGGYSLAVIMLLLAIYVWFRCRVGKAWGDVRSYRLQKLGKGSYGHKRQYTTRPLNNVNKTAGSAGNETVLLHPVVVEWKVLDSIMLLAAKEE